MSIRQTEVMATASVFGFDHNRVLFGRVEKRRQEVCFSFPTHVGIPPSAPYRIRDCSIRLVLLKVF
jgi:hypothetical protein